MNAQNQLSSNSYNEIKGFQDALKNPTPNEESSKDTDTYEKIINTPFALIGNEIKGFSVCMGAHIISEPQKTKEELIEWVWDKPWELIINVISLAMDLKKMLDAGIDPTTNNNTKNETV